MLRRSILQMLIASPAFAATLVAMPGTARASGGGGGSNGGNDSSSGDNDSSGGGSNGGNDSSGGGSYGGNSSSGGTNAGGSYGNSNDGVYGGSMNDGQGGGSLPGMPSGPESHLSGADADDVWLQQQSTNTVNSTLSSDGLQTVSPSSLSSVLDSFQ
ncbi:hypothetical protein RYZ20_06740 [Thioclava sp. A2]|uniref:hypothetical protein n=1 Tax=Thioclava sp. FCG-A2 TaxID=3080562 RepID=UPI0029553084|nr:hypothetical protein [Thioclava sp. A2]MDV7270593.1 hypothetical protein [Thioclava sp. A2]